MRTARRANRRVSMRGGAPFAPNVGDTVSFYKRNEGVADYSKVDEKNSTLATGTFVTKTPGGMYKIKTDGKEHMSSHIGDIPIYELIGEKITVMLPPSYGRAPEEKELTISKIEPYNVSYGSELREHVYTGIDDDGKTPTFYASNINKDN